MDNEKYIEAIARVMHEANRAWCEANGDISQPAWDAAPEWQRSSAINAVEFHLTNPSASASATHDKWMDDKLAAGWTHGAVKDADAKTHPCIVPFDELPHVHRAKDVLARAVVHALKQ